jgi:hypothetical protein
MIAFRIQTIEHRSKRRINYNKNQGNNMHDPQTLAHEIKYPWWKHRPWPRRFSDKAALDGARYAWGLMSDGQRKNLSQMWPDGYRETFVNIWHVDPEKDGSDDSCGYSFVKLTKRQRATLKNAAFWEGQEPHFLRCAEKRWTGSIADCESLERGLILLVCRVLHIKYSWGEICQMAAENVHVRTGGLLGERFCFLPGYHTNRATIKSDDRVEHLYGILCCVAREILTEKRSWWNHPKWHFWHWKIQVPLLMNLKRFLFSRCCKCGKGFSFGYSPVTNNWNSTGPKWFRGEKDIYHSDCNRPDSSGVKSNVS